MYTIFNQYKKDLTVFLRVFTWRDLSNPNQCCYSLIMNALPLSYTAWDSGRNRTDVIHALYDATVVAVASAS